MRELIQQWEDAFDREQAKMILLFLQLVPMKNLIILSIHGGFEDSIGQTIKGV